MERRILSRGRLRVFDHLIEEMRGIIKVLMNIRKTRMHVVAA